MISEVSQMSKKIYTIQEHKLKEMELYHQEKVTNKPIMMMMIKNQMMR